METEDIIVNTGNLTEIQNCQCGKPTKQENFNCDECRKHFCNNCPTKPIGEHCLECLVNESTPEH